ncbi:MAG: Sigma-54-dependent transcriptional activator [Candidatus Ozemobacter sibiricus]|jgi:DNA-binding NtrC family response regulator|uniref:Sigma-54-dependent transcriptional activator n=1 Tax=Candidatus Ozemobacter sibiricus TaxID=2268124 RepID=A0A367ZNK1_9BACT|nr:MAG: Sigma-54-dependent transcriptional activator [Candidatus Ozemobacter sibiricus]
MAIDILVVDDEDMIRWTLKESLEAEGYRVTDFANARDFLRYFQEKGGDIVLLDIRLPDASGLDVLVDIARIDPDVPVVVMTAYGDVETAVTAMKRGAYDYLSKPYNLAEVNLLIRKIVQASLLKSQLNRYLEKEGNNYSQILGENVKMKILREHIAMAAQSDRTTVLIRGESGTGKELVARQIHLQSARANQPFIDVNAAAVTGTLLESELFGHEKGAFTDAQRQKKGVFELADKGTLFLDEIGDLDPNLQAKLLRVLQERRFRRVGGSTDIAVDVRIIAATNADLEKAMEEGRLRRDLFYRLNVFTLFLPPLRERKDDILLMARSFLDMFRKEFSKNVTGFHPETVEILLNYDYPGNVRELKNLIERATLLETTNKIRPSSLPEDMRNRTSPPSLLSGTAEAAVKPWHVPGFNLKDYIDSIEKKIVSEVMAEVEGKKNKAASLLGLTRFALRHQLKKHGLEGDS